MKNWRKKIYLMQHFHIRMKASRRGAWKQGDTAKYFQVSNALVSENMKLFQHYESLRQFRTRDEAIKFFV